MTTFSKYRNRNPSDYVWINTLNSWDVSSITNDPRLISPAHSGQRLTLDTIPLNGKVQIWDTSNITGYKPTSYNSYSHIQGGQNQYYYNKQLATPFINQLFVQPNAVVKQNYIDPMDSYKPHYYRINTYDKNNLTWITDSQFHREDLMSKQLWNRNQSNYQVQANYP